MNRSRSATSIPDVIVRFDENGTLAVFEIDESALHKYTNTGLEQIIADALRKTRHSSATRSAPCTRNTSRPATRALHPTSSAFPTPNYLIDQHNPVDSTLISGYFHPKSVVLWALGSRSSSGTRCGCPWPVTSTIHISLSSR